MVIWTIDDELGCSARFGSATETIRDQVALSDFAHDDKSNVCTCETTAERLQGLTQTSTNPAVRLATQTAYIPPALDKGLDIIELLAENECGLGTG
jgi:hypothetical protein